MSSSPSPPTAIAPERLGAGPVSIGGGEAGGGWRGVRGQRGAASDGQRAEDEPSDSASKGGKAGNRLGWTATAAAFSLLCFALDFSLWLGGGKESNLAAAAARQTLQEQNEEERQSFMLV
jgi:hypothetical protein